MIPTLFAIMVVNFVIVQAAPGGPVEQMIARFKGSDIAATQRVTGGGGELAAGAAPSTAGPAGGGGADTRYRGARGPRPALFKEIGKQYGLDQPPLRRVVLMMK